MSVRTVALKLIHGGNDITLRQLYILLAVAEKTSTVRALAAEMNVPKATVTRSIDRLVDLSLVRRKDDPEDRRSVLAEITAAGRKLTAQVEA